MADDQAKRESPRVGGLDSSEVETEPSMLLQKLKSNISKSVQGKVDTILQEVQRFSDNDKLYLYLQLPSGPSAGEKSSDTSSMNTADQLHTCNWIRSHLEEHADTCLPKQDVYETYRTHCDKLQHRPLSAANFGKIIRDIFPNIKARRLGGRGQSKYCYSGIRRKTVMNMPLLPNLDLKNDPSELTELVQTYKQEVTEAACELICNWAQKILKRSFDTVVDIARFLVQEHIMDPRCSQAELVTSAALAGGPAKPHKLNKKNVAPSKGTEAESSRIESKKDKDGEDQALSGKQQPSEKTERGVESGGRPTGRDLQVEASMKPMRKLLPRGSVLDKQLVLPVTVTTLTQQQGSGVPLMLIPSTVNLSYPEHDKPPSVTVVKSAASTSVVQRTRPPISKRATPDPPTAPSVPGTPPKRKRGRPRKPRAEETLPQALPPAAPIHQATGGVIQKAMPSSSQIVELVIQDPLPSGLQDAAGLEVEHCDGGVVMQSKATAADVRPVLILQSAGQQPWEVSRTMVIQRAPGGPPLPPAMLHEDQGHVEITLSPVESLPHNPSGAQADAQ
ncbi:DNA-binding protein RFX5 [Denticeps clupeoides]|uniref:RFX-type winged-helix domain-containing protein n=1 Tax=Denticeps clupeoides TaxID=299321 RepID=A0AAY4BA11_9TELE|nr:DNA-binding protein RFX5 [Denticeps clupeoides]XP_028852887.1 DNA-binding protein RFX5 [Denticeps clupeoides]